MSNIVSIDDSNWDTEVINSSVPVLVDFWAEWCGPCKTMIPVLEQLSEEYGGKIKVVKVDIEVNMDLASKYSVRSVPTMVVFVGGYEKDRIVGGRPKTFITAILQQYLAKI